MHKSCATYSSLASFFPCGSRQITSTGPLWNGLPATDNAYTRIQSHCLFFPSRFQRQAPCAGIAFPPEPQKKGRNPRFQPVDICMVPKGRIELPRGFPHYPLKIACLPVPPLRHSMGCIDCHIRRPIASYFQQSDCGRSLTGLFTQANISGVPTCAPDYKPESSPHTTALTTARTEHASEAVTGPCTPSSQPSSPPAPIHPATQGRGSTFRTIQEDTHGTRINPALLYQHKSPGLSRGFDHSFISVSPTQRGQIRQTPRLSPQSATRTWYTHNRRR